MIKDLAVAVFGSSMFATHSLSGKIGNANKESQAKPPLDPTKVELIIGIKVLKVFLTLKFFLHFSFRHCSEEISSNSMKVSSGCFTRQK